VKGDARGWSLGVVILSCQRREGARGFLEAGDHQKTSIRR
jgi:hypothetical protein